MSYEVDPSWPRSTTLPPPQSYFNTQTHKVVPKDAVVATGPLATPGVLRHWADYVRGSWPGMAAAFEKQASQIEEQTKPPRVPEPGWGEKVIAHVRFNEDRLRWVRVDNGTKRHWSCEDDGEYDRTWEELLDPELV